MNIVIGLGFVAVAFWLSRESESERLERQALALAEQEDRRAFRRLLESL